MKINLFIAGVQKGGTSTLHSYLVRHRSIQAPAKKELHFFDNERIFWADPNYNVYHRKFLGIKEPRVLKEPFAWADAKLQESRFPIVRTSWNLFRKNSGEAHRFSHVRLPENIFLLDSTPIHTFWEPSMQRMYNYNPAAKLIVLFRDPIERAYSNWNMSFSNARDTLEFSEAIRDGRKRLAKAPALSRPHRLFSYVERGFYARQLTRLFQYFDKKQTLFLLSEELFADPARVLNQVTTFLDIDPLPVTKKVHSYKGNYAQSKIPPNDIEFLLDIYTPEVKAFKDITGLDTGIWKYAGKI